jgi:hypothetical protein
LITESLKPIALRGSGDLLVVQEGEMKESNNRLTEPGSMPSDSAIAEWIGKGAYTYWKQVTHLIEQIYPNVFTPEWLFGGRKHGWTLRYKKNKSFCTLIPEKNRFAILLVFGSEERAKVDAMRDSLSLDTQKKYDEATTYHDGKWLVLSVSTDKVLEDVMRLLAVKRRPKHDNNA